MFLLRLAIADHLLERCSCLYQLLYVVVLGNGWSCGGIGVCNSCLVIDDESEVTEWEGVENLRHLSIFNQFRLKSEK